MIPPIGTRNAGKMDAWPAPATSTKSAIARASSAPDQLARAIGMHPVNQYKKEKRFGPNPIWKPFAWTLCKIRVHNFHWYHGWCWVLQPPYQVCTWCGHVPALDEYFDKYGRRKT